MRDLNPTLQMMENQLQKLLAEAQQRIIDCERQIGQLQFSFWSKQPQLRLVDDEGGNWTMGWQQFGGTSGERRIAVLDPDEDKRALFAPGMPRLIVILASKQLTLFRTEVEERMQDHLLVATKK